MNNYLADTTLIIEHLRIAGNATTFLVKFTPFISLVTIAELIQGSKDKREQNQVIKVCSGLSEVLLDRNISEKALELMKKFCLSHGLQILDALIAATALNSKFTLITDNVKHFKFIPGLKLLSHSEAFKKT